MTSALLGWGPPPESDLKSCFSPLRKGAAEVNEATGFQVIGCAQEKFYVRSRLGDGFRAHKCAFEARFRCELEAVLFIAVRHLED